MNRNTGMNAGQIIGTMNGLQVVGLDIAKLVFQLHTVDMSTGEIVNMQIKRAQVLEHFANRRPCLIAIEACGGAHYWARELIRLGHNVRLLHAKMVRPLVGGNKTDATDARGIWLAVQQPGVKFVGIKSAAQQATLTLHRQRELLMKMRNMQTNALRGLLYEFGATFAKWKKALFSEIEETLERLAGALPQMVVDSLREQVTRIKAITADMQAIERRLAQHLRLDPQMKLIAQIPGVGLLTATAAIATMGQASAFKSGREFCAWLGLVPQTDGHRRQGETWEHLQARRQLRQDATHSRSPQRTVARQRARAVAGTDQESQTGQRGDRGTSGQNGQNDLGGHCQGTRFPTRLQERQAASGVRRMSRFINHPEERYVVAIEGDEAAMSAVM